MTTPNFGIRKDERFNSVRSLSHRVSRIQTDALSADTHDIYGQKRIYTPATPSITQTDGQALLFGESGQTRTYTLSPSANTPQIMRLIITFLAPSSTPGTVKLQPTMPNTIYNGSGPVSEFSYTFSSENAAATVELVNGGLDSSWIVVSQDSNITTT